jgi:hypothetical protein
MRLRHDLSLLASAGHGVNWHPLMQIRSYLVDRPVP